MHCVQFTKTKTIDSVADPKMTTKIKRGGETSHIETLLLTLKLDRPLSEDGNITQLGKSF